MGGGVPPGNTIPVSAKWRKPKKKAKGSWPPWQPEDGVSLGAGSAPGRKQVLLLLQFLVSLKLAQPPWVASSITVATVRLMTTIWFIRTQRPSLLVTDLSQALQDQNPRGPKASVPMPLRDAHLLVPMATESDSAALLQELL